MVCTKGVLSGLVGIAIQKGYLIGLDQKMMDFFPQFADGKPNPKVTKVILRNLLTMSDGISHSEMDYYFTKDRLSGEFRAEPGAESFYNSMSPQILSMIITKATGDKALDFAIKHLFNHLGIADASWDYVEGYSR